jgi:hypothetical protein
MEEFMVYMLFGVKCKLENMHNILCGIEIHNAVMLYMCMKRKSPGQVRALAEYQDQRKGRAY